MSDEEITVFKQVEELFTKIATLKEEIINAVIKKIVDKLIELRILHPSIDFFGDKGKQSVIVSDSELDFIKRLPRNNFSPILEENDANELNVIIQKEANAIKLLACGLAAKRDVEKMGSTVNAEHHIKPSEKLSSGNIVQEPQVKDSDRNEISKIVVSKKDSSVVKFMNGNVIKGAAAVKGDQARHRFGARPYRWARKPKFVCDTCKHITFSKLALRKHVHKHLVSNKYKCSICEKCFSASTCLRIHMKRHANQRDFPCDRCEYRAFTKMERELHMTVHTGEKNHVCDICGKVFTKERSLKEHFLTVHELGTKKHCPQCDFTTYTTNSLRVHRKIRHEGELNNYVCPVCGGKVKVRSAFLEHMRSHTGEKPFSCDKCKSSFACASRLKAHKESVHAPRRFHCLHCTKVFQTKHHMLRHQTIHTNEKPYGCPFCSYVCNTQGNLTKHVRLIHHAKEYSFRKQKAEQELIKGIKEEWVEKGQKFTEEYLKTLSEKVGRNITIEELRVKEDEKIKNQILKVQKTKPRNSKHLETKEHSYSSNKQETILEVSKSAATNEMAVSMVPTSSPPAVLIQLPDCSANDSASNEINFKLETSEGQVFQVLPTIGGTTLSDTHYVQVDPAPDISHSPVLKKAVHSLVSTGASGSSVVTDREVYELVSDDSVCLCVNDYECLEENMLGVEIHLEEMQTVDSNNINVSGPEIQAPASYSSVEGSKTDSENTVLVIINTEDTTTECKKCSCIFY